MASKAKEGKNTDPSPMTYEVAHFPSLAQQRARLAMEADSLTVSELRTEAAEAQIDTAGASTKKELVDAVKSGARGNVA